MKRKLLIAAGFLLTQSCSAQVLFTENFENYTLGNMFTTVSNNTIPGQGGWYLLGGYSDASMANAYKITQEPNRGKVLTLTTVSIPTQKTSLKLVKQGLDTFINQRTAGNNVLKLEVDYYTGEQHNVSGFTPSQIFGLNYGNNAIGEHNNHLLRLYFISDKGEARVHYNRGDTQFPYMRFGKNGVGRNNLPYNTWITYIIYLDYNNGKIYCEIPYLNAIGVGDQFLANSSSTNLFEDFKPTEIRMNFSVHDEGRNIPLTNKYDNIKITALNAVPPHILSAESFLASHFSMYPNPASNIVTITNSENFLVQQIAVYDTAGKLITTDNYNNKTEIQLNIEDLASGTYLLHL